MASPGQIDMAQDRDGDALLSLVRICALECRAMARGAVPACLAIDPEAELVDVAMLLARGLPAMMLRRPVFWRPGTPGRSFDEAWFLSLAAAMVDEDHDSVRFLLERRVQAHARRAVKILMTALLSRHGACKIDLGCEAAGVRPHSSKPQPKGAYHGRNSIRPVPGRHGRDRERA